MKIISVDDKKEKKIWYTKIFEQVKKNKFMTFKKTQAHALWCTEHVFYLTQVKLTVKLFSKSSYK